MVTARPSSNIDIWSRCPTGTGYDGGDCCECTCNDTPQFICGDPQFGGFACLDPNAPCVDDDDVTAFPDDTTTLSEYTDTFGCNTGWISDGDCDSSNNKKDCGASRRVTWYIIEVSYNGGP